MDENASGRAHDLLPAPETAAGNIRRFLDEHRSGSPRATSSEMRVSPGSTSGLCEVRCGASGISISSLEVGVSTGPPMESV